jgi:hypothetical protein
MLAPHLLARKAPGPARFDRIAGSSCPLKNGMVEFFNLAKGGTKSRTARK